MSGNGFPFRSEPSLAPLVRFWTDPLAGGNSIKAAVARVVADEIAKAPELLQPFADAKAIARHEKLVEVLMTAAVPPASWEQEYGAAMIPFQLRALHATPAMRRLLLTDDGRLKGRFSYDDSAVEAMRTVLAYVLILRRVYGVEVPV